LKSSASLRKKNHLETGGFVFEKTNFLLENNLKNGFRDVFLKGFADSIFMEIILL